MPTPRSPRAVLPPDLEVLSPSSDDGDAGTTIDLAAHTRMLRSILRRRYKLALAVLVVVMTISAMVLRKLPKIYRVETRLLAQRSESLPAAFRQGNGRDDPTKAAPELIHRRENLIELVKQTGLFKPETRLPSLRERVGLPPLGIFGPALNEEDQLNNLVNALDSSLLVTTTDTVVTISIDWGNPNEAYQIVEAAMQSFFEARQLQELNAIEEIIGTLNGHTQSAYHDLQQVQADVERERLTGMATVEARASDRRANPLIPAVPVARKDSEEVLQLRGALEAKQHAIRDLEDFRRRRLADLQAQLDEKRGIYSDAFPSVVSLKQDIEAVSQDSPQLATLRADEKKLEIQLAAKDGGSVPDAAGSASTPSSTRAAPARALRGTLLPESNEQSERIRDARFKYERMAERMNQAQLELDSARAGFKYRYGIISPAQVPKKPIRPKPTLVLGTGAFFAFVLALLVSVAVDRWKGLIYDEDELEEVLDVPVLARINASSLRSPL